MNYLGIDLGRKTLGIAYSEGNLATPQKTLKIKNFQKTLEEISLFCKELSIDKIIIGYVEEKKGFFEKFAQNLMKLNPKIQVILWDETLSTRQARQSMIKLQVSKTKRGKKEHEFAASLILQSYLDSHD